ncbi:MAG: hypothetical protein RL662_566 [Bacteroidota bacterium]|jgi:acetyl esterase/lipase
MIRLFLLLLSTFFIMTTHAQTTIKLWEDLPPTNNSLTEPEQIAEDIVSSVSIPEMFVYFPEKSSNKKMAIIICPGGGYSHLAIDHEGTQFAKWLQAKGIVGVVLKYRMPNKCKQIPLEDLRQSMAYVQSKAREWDIVDETGNSKIGVAGFSAGGHLVSTLSTHHTTNDLRPDFSILFYPVITMGNHTHEGSRNQLLGDTRTASDILYYSNETHVDKKTPPTLLLLSDDDHVVSPHNSLMYYTTLKENDIPASMYIFPEGGHGWGMRENFKYHSEMLSLLSSWLEKFY